jgi:hypothetical protein
MEFVLAGFRQDNNVRRYAFEAVDSNRRRVEFTVGVDLTLVRKHHIPMQELPLLCRMLLADYQEGGPLRTFNFTEADMLGYVKRRAVAQDAAEQKRRSHRRPHFHPRRSTAPAATTNLN